MRRALIALGTAALLAAPVVPASAATADLTCHPPRYDTYACVCGAAARALTAITGDPWYCAGS